MAKLIHLIQPIKHLASLALDYLECVKFAKQKDENRNKGLAGRHVPNERRQAGKP